MLIVQYHLSTISLASVVLLLLHVISVVNTYIVVVALVVIAAFVARDAIMLQLFFLVLV